MSPHIWSFLAAIPPSLGAFFAWMEARSAKRNSQITVVNTNGNMTRLAYRNAQLAIELSKHNIEIPPPLEDHKDEGNP